MTVKFEKRGGIIHRIANCSECERANAIDGITARDKTIELLEKDLDDIRQLESFIESHGMEVPK